MANCTFHPEKASVAFCRSCGAALCADCTRDVRGLIYCEGCLARRMEGTEAAVPQAQGFAPPPPAATVASVASVGLATFLGFIPGVGAMYNGQIRKAFAHVAVFAALVAAANREDMFGIFVAAFIAYMVLDAHKTAKARIQGTTLPDYLGLGALVGEESAPGVKAAAGQAFQKAGSAVEAAAPGPKVPVGATILIALGVLFLLSNLGLFHIHWFRLTWPLGLVVLGGYLGLRRWNESSCPCTRCRMNRMMWPVLMVTFGTLVALDRMLHIINGEIYIGVLLIVFGGVRLLQTSAPMDGHIQPGEIPAHEIPPVPPAGQHSQS